MVAFSRQCGPSLFGQDSGFRFQFNDNGQRKKRGDKKINKPMSGLDFMFVPTKASPKHLLSSHQANWVNRAVDTVVFSANVLATKYLAMPGAVFLAMTPPSLALPQSQVDEPPPPTSIWEILFPKFSWDSFIARVSILQVAEYLGSVFLGGKSTPTTCGLYLLGASWGPAIATGQLHRLIFPMMLHANGLHIFFNIFFQSRIGFGMEQQFGHKKFMWLYLFCGFFGNLMSVAADPYKLAVGASTSGFGLVGVYLAEVLLTYHVMGSNRWKVFLWSGMMISAVGIMAFLAPNVDLIGHLGGMIGGFLLATVLSDMQPEHAPEWYEQWRDIAKKLLIISTALGMGKVLFLNPHTPLPECGSLFHPHAI